MKRMVMPRLLSRFLVPTWENVIRMTPGPAKYAAYHIDDIKSCFKLFLTESIETIVMNLEGKRIY